MFSLGIAILRISCVSTASDVDDTHALFGLSTSVALWFSESNSLIVNTPFSNMVNIVIVVQAAPAFAAFNWFILHLSIVDRAPIGGPSVSRSYVWSLLLLLFTFAEHAKIYANGIWWTVLFFKLRD